MTFLTPPAMWGLLAVAALPFLIHWLSRRFPKKYVFSSLADLKKAVAGRSRVFKWRHFLYLLLRALAVVALVLAFLNPVLGLGKKDAQEGHRHVLIAIDRSLSMAHRDGNFSTWKRTRSECERLLASLDPLDKVNLVMVGRTPETAFSQFSHNVAAARQFLAEQEPQPVEANFKAANSQLTRLAEQAEGPVEIYYLSDFQRKNWANIHFETLPPQARLLFIPTTDDGERANQAILSASLGEEAPVRGRPFTVRARVANFSADHYHGRLEVVASESQAREVPLQLVPWAESEISVEFPALPPGLHALTLRLGQDQLTLDNTRWLVVEVGEAEETLILTTAREGEPSPPARFLRAAVNPYGERGEEGGSYRVRELVDQPVTAPALSGTSKVLASRTAAWSEEEAALLATYLTSGGGMILFLDGDKDRENLAQLALASGTELPLELTTRLSSANLPGGAMKVARGDFRSPFLRLFEGERRRNLAFLEFYDFYHAIPTGEGRILLHYADGTPAMAEAQVGLGTLLLCNFSVSELSSNLARQQLFPGWIHDLLAKLGQGETLANDYQLGDSVSFDTWASEVLGREMRSPSGEKMATKIDLRGERAFLTFTPEEPGIHSLPGRGGRLLRAFAVNPSESESDLRTLDVAVLPERAPKDSQGAQVKGGQSFRELSQGRPIFHWFVLTALLLLGVESLLHALLAPQSRPTRTT
ncbi:vWA domain-containing protein [Roseibacillus ishigakijimensis]|uniref:BatA and WFA domain-containing protein n=1 Tax=Roseibacillus ishigakijimensis TaxID=454146 RepID=A0A934VLB8_9BACT|nr:BatA and WFA domain-containing protein [Roseibacillus ishigakijimensis]MBK1833072.1 BatA and WFA domain-containing protein [Roseibacillus ishigakijimensis]